MPNPKRKRGKKNWQSIGNSRSGAGVKGGFQNATLGDIEDSDAGSFIVQIASRASTNAINENKAMNIPVTLMKDGWIVQMNAEGEIFRLKKIEQETRTRVYRSLTKGTKLHVKGNQ